MGHNSVNHDIFTLIGTPIYFVNGATEVRDSSMLTTAAPSSTFSEPGPISLQAFSATRDPGP